MGKLSWSEGEAFVSWLILWTGICLGIIAFTIARLSYLYGYHAGWIHCSLYVSQTMAETIHQQTVEELKEQSKEIKH